MWMRWRNNFKNQILPPKARFLHKKQKAGPFCKLLLKGSKL